MSEKLNAVVETLEALTLGECLELVKTLEERWDVEATPKMPGFLSQSPQEEEEPEQTTFDVVVKETGAKRIQAIKAVKEALSCDLKSAKAAIETLPATILKGVDRETADKVAEALNAAGAVTEVK